MFKRLHIRSPWDTLFYCGESTCMGTGTPAVTVSGLTAANAILKKRGLEPFTYKKDMPNYVEIVPHPFKRSELFTDEPEANREVMRFASECLYCEHPPCMDGTVLDVRGINRRVSVGNFIGAKRLVSQFMAIANEPAAEIREAQYSCIKNLKNSKAVEVEKIVMHLNALK
jgi:prolycopene isomerase